MDTEQYLVRVRAALGALANPELAAPMRAYQRDQFPFLGIKTPERRQAVAALGKVRFSGAETLAVANALWEFPEREFQYVAVDLLARHANGLTVADIPALLALVQRKSWWDSVDGLAKVVGAVIHRARVEDPQIQRLMDDALTHDNLWVRRIALLHQLGWYGDCDAGRLFRYAATCAPETEFFIRKAIGWALRDYARHDPDAVRRFVEEHRQQLSGLSVREAMKHLGGV
ncbi:MAG: DNA alkylation repair protein [Fluviicoccus sp.]|uniref:DNA alkylation repair protein n=1 Tax=Fluviicoccus sp. TaxID=2003552 RepID=UPI00271B947B|nr:DNA alkylation repair protein [Fluviicoccus sp.]MDO8330978.1 DNA alkylation repair protein [Fluviicoccus sp.]